MSTFLNRPTLNRPTFPRFKEQLSGWSSSSPIRHLTNHLTVRLFDLYAASQGYKFVLATSEAEKEEAYQLRYRVYAESDYMPAYHDDEPRLTDKYDEVSAIFLAYHHNQCVGTLRLTRLDYGTNTQDYFNVSLEHEPQQVVDIGKFAVDNCQRSQARVTGLGLVLMAYAYSLQNNIQVWLGCAPIGLLRSFRDFIPTHILPQLPPTEQHFLNRARRSGYFEKYGDNIKPFQMLMSEMNCLHGFYNSWWPLLKAKYLQLANG